jgi:hypothetical protein
MRPHCRRQPTRSGWSALAIALIGLAVAAGHTTRVWGAFSSNASTVGNTFTSGTVLLTDNDTSVMFNLSGMKPADAAVSKCITVTYGGTLPADVRLYGTTTGSGLDAFTELTVTRGTFNPTDPGFSSCTNFVADGTSYIGAGNGIVFQSDLVAWPDDYATGLADPPTGSVEQWTTGETHVYKFTAGLKDDLDAANRTATQVFTWEARNL